MQLFCPAFLSVQAPEEQHEEAGKLRGLERCRLAAAAHFVEDLLCFAFAGLGKAEIQTMIGEAASAMVEIIVAFAESLKQVGKPRHIKVAHGSKFVDPYVEGNGIIGAQRSVGTESRENPDM